jgi:hypothetical protein
VIKQFDGVANVAITNSKFTANAAPYGAGGATLRQDTYAQPKSTVTTNCTTPGNYVPYYGLKLALNLGTPNAPANTIYKWTGAPGLGGDRARFGVASPGDCWRSACAPWAAACQAVLGGGSTIAGAGVRAYKAAADGWSWCVLPLAHPLVDARAAASLHLAGQRQRRPPCRPAPPSPAGNVGVDRTVLLGMQAAIIQNPCPGQGGFIVINPAQLPVSGATTVRTNVLLAADPNALTVPAAFASLVFPEYGYYAS